MKIGVVNISIGNVGSVVEAFNFLRNDAEPVSNSAQLDEYDLLVLAGVGNYNTAMEKMNQLGFVDALRDQVQAGKPVLGICLGMQLFSTMGLEDGQTNGFDWIPGTVKKIEDSSVKVPHMGWNTVHPKRNDLFEGIERSTFYFMHSYHFDVANDENVIATVNYGEGDMVAAVRKDNIIGVQFHPEKSQGDGLRFLKNLVEDIAS